ncbi:MAG: hypothetical protein NW214_16550 [Pseudanabaenaceae cyanobacterium bins.39]|nr:hypothetical protein [Pseudanabaenaceae cyanobacterium bins.39]
MNAAITLGKDTELVEKLDRELLGNLKWLAEQLEKLGGLKNDKITASIALRHAIAMDALLLDEMGAKSRILIKRQTGKITEININRESLDCFQQNFAEDIIEKVDSEIIQAKFEPEIVGNLKWVAEKLEAICSLDANSVRLPIAMRHAIAMDAMMLDEMTSKSKILIKKEGGGIKEIKIDGESIRKFKENFAIR